MVDWFSNDKLFLQELTKGHKFELLVGFELLAAGFVVEVPEVSLRTSVADRHEYLNQVDMLVHGVKGALFSAPIHIEVKSRDVRFTSCSDWPYPSCFVDTVGGWTAKARKPRGVVVISQVTTSKLFIPSSGMRWWGREVKHDTKRGIDEEFYAAPSKCLKPWGWLLAKLAEGPGPPPASRPTAATAEMATVARLTPPGPHRQMPLWG